MTPDPSERKLAAILHADVVGYSRLMGEDEVATLRLLKEHIQAIVELVEAHHGAVANIAGDAVLAVYPSIVEALQCAVRIQAMLGERNADLPDSRKLVFRIGINIGDVIFDADSVYGDGVNVAARLEALAEPAGICISRSAYEQVRAKVPYEFTYVGEQHVKNIAEAVGVYRVDVSAQQRGGGADTGRESFRPGVSSAPSRKWVIAAVFAAAFVLSVGAWYLGSTSNTPPFDISVQSARLSGVPSIAVLPFDNVGGDAEQSYLSDGMADDLITDLTKLSGLLVIARDSTFAYRNEPLDIGEIARRLDVRYILHGSVRRAGDQIRINAQLIDTANGSQIWAERYDGKLAQIFALQDKVARSVVSALSVTLTSGEQSNLARADTNSLEAYDFFLRGQQHFYRHSLSDNRQAQKLYERSLQQDPGFARAYAMLALTQWFEFANGWAESPAEALQQAQRYASEAINRNDALPIAYFVSGLVYREQKEYDKARKEAEKALALDPNYANGRVLLASVLYYTGHAREGLQLMEEAKRLNPNYPHNYPFHIGQAYFILGDYKKAIQVFKEGLNRNPSSQRLRLWLVAAFAQDNQLEEARWQLQEVNMEDPDLSIERISGAYPFKFNADLANFLDGLRKAGMKAK